MSSICKLILLGALSGGFAALTTGFVLLAIRDIALNSWRGIEKEHRPASLYPEAKESVQALISLLGDPDDQVRWRTARALGDIGPEAKEAVPALIKSLSDPDLWVRRFAALALGQIGPEAKSAIRELERLAEKDPDESARQTAHDALEKIRK